MNISCSLLPLVKNAFGQQRKLSSVIFHYGRKLRLVQVTIPYLLFPIYYSLFTIPYSLLLSIYIFTQSTIKSVTPVIFSMPASFRDMEQLSRVEPVVQTSSRRITLSGSVP